MDSDARHEVLPAGMLWRLLQEQGGDSAHERQLRLRKLLETFSYFNSRIILVQCLSNLYEAANKSFGEQLL